MLKRLFRTFLVSTIVAFFTASVNAQSSDKLNEGIHTVVIDAGHGGKDPGAVGKRAKEKDIALIIALKVGKYIEENIPDVKVIYTRKKDVYVQLWKRADISNKAEADLFISIHVNAHTKTTARGTLTLVLGQHRRDENFEVAVRENSVILLEEDYETRYEGFDPKSAESYIMFDLMQKTYFKQSIEFGDHVQDQFRERAGRRDLGVREQGLQVLAQIAMPGVLVETGFISNPEEERYLMTEYGQDIIASAIFRGFRDYKNAIDRRSHPEVIIEKEAVVSEAVETESVPDEVKGLIFSVQLASSKNESSTEPAYFKGQKGVWLIKDGRWFKYLSGKEKDYHTALEMCEEVKKNFPDAFIVASKEGKIIPLHEALLEIQK